MKKKRRITTDMSRFVLLMKRAFREWIEKS